MNDNDALQLSDATSAMADGSYPRPHVRDAQLSGTKRAAPGPRFRFRPGRPTGAPMESARYLIVTADDFGIGPATTRGILELATLGRITATVLLVNSPYAEDAVRDWRLAGRPVELGWHPCLTIDQPVLPPQRVPSLVDCNGQFWRLSRFLFRLHMRRIVTAEVEDELRAQYRRFIDLVGTPPTVVNAHHHSQIFSPVERALATVCGEQVPLPYLRNVRDPWWTLLTVPGARWKRVLLSHLGRRSGFRQRYRGFWGNDSLAGITDPRCVEDTSFFARWLRRVPGKVVELTCHPGHFDSTLIDRDCSAADGQLQRRPTELRLLQETGFLTAVHDAGFTLISPSHLRVRLERGANAA
jgi:predicted glycoside hydrolase/deacetylase ChbG (UPF0249 family)